MAQTQSQQSFESFDQLINKIRKSPKALRDKGTLFEYMTKVYLEQAYPEKFANVWMLKEVPSWTGISHQDLGVDLVCQDEADPSKFIAVQDKFYEEDHVVSKPDVDSFVAELGKNVYSEGIWIATNDCWNRNADKMLEGTSKPITRVGLSDLRHANIDWSKFDATHLDSNFKHSLKKSHKHLRPYQKDAVKHALKYYRQYYQQGKNGYRRGKLIMAPGTGKTYTSLNIAEALQDDEHKKNFYVLYLVPSIQLLSQTLFSWARDVNNDTNMVKFAVTSDRNATKARRKTSSDISAVDIGFPATTNADKLKNNYDTYTTNHKDNQKRMYVVFSTYQSIDVIHQVQEEGFPEFNLTICDEAHRTAGHYRSRTTEGFFTEILHNDYVHSQLRLFQTATPKVYGDKAKKKSQDHSVVIASMDNPILYGKTFYYLSFGDAVDHGILTDYKVQVLTIDENFIDKNMQNSISTPDNGIRVNDIGKIIGTWNAMLKRKSFSNKTWGKPMQRAIAFAQVIDNQKGKRSAGKVGSKQIAREFNYVMQEYLGNDYDSDYHIDIRHVDGSMNAMQKKNALDWLSRPVPDNSAKILSNVKFLGEGVDVPSLDAVIFYAPKQSQIDIVQAVGRVMRRFPNKEYGYIILPIVVPYGKDPKEVLDRNKTYKSVWQVLNALRSIDERFDAEVNKLSLHNYKSQRIMITGEGDKPKDKVKQLDLPLWHSIYGAIKGEIVKHVGNRRYLDDWSDDVAKIAKRHINWINLKLKDPNSPFTKSFGSYLASLRHNINDQITKRQAVEMIAQHIITKPVFDALFSNNDFVNNNPVSKAMEGITQKMVQAGFQKEQSKLKPFYKSVKLRASGINDANDKQQFIKTLYNEFFSKSFSATTSRLGIVFTPVPIVNFIVHSVDYALHKYFGKSIASKGVNVLDPFVGTGTFITQTLYYLADLWQQHKIKLSDIVRNYTQELYCNEIVLLSYYIAAINIESVFNEIVHNKHYQAFKGIVLTDTFESTERDNVLDEGMFNGNNKRLVNEKNQPITVIMSNPPYSKGQKTANDNQLNVHYPKIESEINNTYIKYSKISNTVSLYNSYIKALRWSSDRIGDNGVLGFVTNAEFLDSKSADGIRKCLHDEFNYLYIYNLRGNARLAGDERRKEGDPIFGLGSRSPIAISIMIKDGSNNHNIYYKDIGDYLSRFDKFNIIKKNKSIKNIKWTKILPNRYNDWINKRDPNYERYIPLNDRYNSSVFPYNSLGIVTSRDAWVYGFSKLNIIKNVKKLIDHYNNERKKLSNHIGKINRNDVNRDPKYINWSYKLMNLLRHDKPLKFYKNHLRLALYRPFVKKWIYYDKDLVDSPRLYYSKFGNNNYVIDVTGIGANRAFSTLATTLIPDYGTVHNGRGYMRYNRQNTNGQLLRANTDNINVKFARALGLSTDDAFYYIYGVLNSKDYINRYKNNLKDEIARIPLVRNVKPFVEIGKKLMWLHIHYEDVKPYSNLTIQYHSKNPSYHVTKMRHPSPQRKHRDTIKFNSDITIKDIPLKAYKYVVNGKPAIDWILDQYRIKKDKKSGIVDDPNKFSKNPKYIFNLLLKVINVSMKTVDLVNKLPKMQIINYDWRKH